MSVVRGLSILELVAHRGTVSFSKLVEGLSDIPKASLIRLLNELVEYGYLIKTETGYRCGDRLGIFIGLRDVQRPENLIDQWSATMASISERHGVTSILLERVGDVLICIKRTESDYSPVMQQVGFRNYQPEHVWYQMLVAAAPGLAGIALKKHPDIEDAVARWRVQGYADDEGTFRPDMRRLAFPIYDETHTCIGVLGIGGSPHQMNTKRRKELIQEIRKKSL